MTEKIILGIDPGFGRVGWGVIAKRLVGNTRFGLVLGSEGRGVGVDIKSLATASVRIPMNAGVESLNVAVAGGIAMYKLQCTNYK